MNFKNSSIYTILFSFVFTFIFVFILSTVYKVTTPEVEKNQKLFYAYSVLNAFGIEYNNEDEAIQIYENDIQKEIIDNQEYLIYEAKDDTYYGTVYDHQGLWGIITAVLSVDTKNATIQGLDFISQNETPGLGGRIVEDWFKAQFQGKALDTPIVLNTTGGTGNFDTSSPVIDGVTGASVTSGSVVKAVNEQIQNLKNYVISKK